MRAKLTELDGLKLVRLWTVVPEEGAVRTVWVTEEVFEAVEPIRDGTWDDYRLSEFRGSLDAWTRGEEVSVAEDPFDKDPNAFLARVHPVEKELWDFRALNPPQGIRCLGAFAGFNEFVALVWDYRENIEGAAEWNAIVERCGNAWSDLFGSIEPHKGESLNAYLSHYYVG